MPPGGGLSSRPCCSGLNKDRNNVCKRCAPIDESPSEGRPCCDGLVRVGLNPILCKEPAPAGTCRQAGEPFSIYRSQCCEGLVLVDQTLDCVPASRQKKGPKIDAQKSVSDCTAEQLNRIEEKLDRLLSMR